MPLTEWKDVISKERKQWWVICFIPTPLGKSSFKWRSHFLGKPFRSTLDDAQLALYLWKCEDKSTEIDAYRGLVLQPFIVEGGR